MNRVSIEDQDLDESDGESESSIDEEEEDDVNGDQLEFYSDNMRAPTASAEDFDSESESHSTDNSIGDEVEQQTIDSNEEYIKQFSNIDVSNQISKGKALRNELIIWDNLLEFRIKVQKVVIDCNRFPQFDCLAHLKTSDDQQLNSSLKESKKSMKRLLDLLLEIDSTLDSQNQLLSTETHSSETNDELSEENCLEMEDKTQSSTQRKSGLKRKHSDCSDYCELLSKRHIDLTKIRNNIIDKWYERTRFTSSSFKQKSFNGLEQSSTQQINRILMDMERLIARTQTKRSLYSSIGKDDINSKTNETNNQSNSSENFDKEIDPEIFDDDDFYHQLLRELIESKAGNDSMLMSGKWVQIQKLRNKIRRKVDTRASKGRKIRYDIHSKLVNFMAPVDNTTFTEDAKNQLFNSLFGQKLE